jgi:hypothetical protein
VAAVNATSPTVTARLSVGSPRVENMTTSLVYGASPYGGYLTIVPEGAIEEATAEIRRVLSLSTYGEARAAYAPGADDDELGDDEPYDVRELGLVADGDWPPNAGMLALEKLPPDVLERLTAERSMVGQEWVEFSEDDEQRVVQELTAAGYEVRRDDAAIDAFDRIRED